MKTKAYIILALLFLTTTIFAQEKIKFGTVSQEELAASVYAKEPSMPAMVLHEEKHTYYDFSNSGLRVISSYFIRMKIFTNDGLEYANASIIRRVGNTRSDDETISKLAGNTFNLENGKITQVKLSKEHIFEEKINDHISRTKFAFQAVKPGSIIEYRYNISSPYYMYLNDYIFQRDIPVKYSLYELSIPEYFLFDKESKGMDQVVYTDKGSAQTTLLSNGQNLSYSNNIMQFEVVDLPALKEEGNVWCVRDYYTRVSFELRGIRIPGSLYKDFSNSWQSVETALMDYNNFGKQFRNKFFKDELSSLFTPEMTDVDKVRAVYNFVRSRVKSNDINTLWANDPKEALKKGIGTSGEINAILISALKEAKFDPYPVVMSLRSRGRIPITRPTMDNLNYFIVGIDIDGKPVYMDASSKYGDLNVLPIECMSDFTRSLRGNTLSNWVDLSKINKSTEMTLIQAAFNEDGLLAGSTQEVINNERAYTFRLRHAQYKDEQEFIERIQSAHNMTISNFEIQQLENTAERIKTSFDFVKNDVAAHDEYVYFNPLISPIIKENPFKEENRKLPIEFSYPYDQRMNIRISLPKGYAVEELPRPVKIALNDKNDISFSYAIEYNKEEHVINIIALFSTNRLIYTSKEYPLLRDFYAMITTQNNAQVVLKKISE